MEFLFQFVVSAPEQGELFKGMFYPWCTDCGSRELLQAVGIVGAVIMPHNLYLHSALVKVSSDIVSDVLFFTRIIQLK